MARRSVRRRPAVDRRTAAADFDHRVTMASMAAAANNKYEHYYHRWPTTTIFIIADPHPSSVGLIR